MASYSPQYSGVTNIGLEWLQDSNQTGQPAELLLRVPIDYRWSLVRSDDIQDCKIMASCSSEVTNSNLVSPERLQGSSGLELNSKLRIPLESPPSTTPTCLYWTVLYY